MPNDRFNNRNHGNSQEEIRKPAENTTHRAESTLLDKKIIRLPNGQEFVISITYLQKDQQGQWEKVTIELPITDASGRFISPETIVGVSWTGLGIPFDHFAACLNPWKDHGYRLVYLNIDGFISKEGKALCTDCNEKNDKKRKLKKYLFGLYRPDIF